MNPSYDHPVILSRLALFPAVMPLSCDIPRSLNKINPGRIIIDPAGVCKVSPIQSALGYDRLKPSAFALIVKADA